MPQVMSTVYPPDYKGQDKPLKEQVAAFNAWMQHVHSTLTNNMRDRKYS